MSHHPAYTMGGLCVIGGLAGFVRSRSIPSLIAGVAIGGAYLVSGYLLQENKDYGRESALLTSALLTGAMLPRAIKTAKPVPIVLSVVALSAGAYYTKKIYEFKYGV